MLPPIGASFTRYVALSAVMLLALAATSPAADFYWSGGSGSSDNIDQDDNWHTAGHPSSGDTLKFDNTSGSRHWPYSNYGGGSWFGDIITYSGAGGIKWRGDTTYAYKFENHNDPVLFELEAAIGNRGGPDFDLEINPVGSGGIKVDNGVTISGSKWLKVYGANQLELYGAIAGSGVTLRSYDTATIILHGENTFSGDLYIDGGAVDLRNTTDPLDVGRIYVGDTANADDATLRIGADGVTVDNPITVQSGNSGVMTLGIDAAGAGTFSGDVTLNKAAALYAASGGTVTFSGTIGGDQDVTLSGAGTVKLTAENTFGASHVLYLDRGTLELNRASGDPLACSELKLGYQANDATLRLRASSGMTLDNPINVRSTGDTKILENAAGANSVSSSIYLDGDLTVLATSGSLTFSGSEFDIKQKVLSIAGDGDVVLDTNLKNSVGSGDQYVVKLGTGTLTGSANSVFGGVVYVNDGALVLSHDEGIGSGELRLGNDAAGNEDVALLLTGGRSVDNSLVVRSGNSGGVTIGSTDAANDQTISGQLTLNKNAVLTAASGRTVTFSGTLTGGAGVTKAGDGTVALTGGSSDYSGATVVSAGTLLVGGGSPNSAVTVQSGATLRGTGSLGETSVGGTAAPGTAAGDTATLTVAALTFAGGGTYAWELDDVDGTAGTDWDLLKVGATGAGAVAVTASSGSKFTIAIDDAAGFANFDNTQAYSWKLVDGGALSGFAETSFTIDESNWSAAKGTGAFTLRREGGDLYLDFTPAGSATYEWDAGGGSGDRDWSTVENWQANTEPTAADTAHINGGLTADVTQAGEACLDLYLGDAGPGTGSVSQTGGDLTVADDLVLGSVRGDHGVYVASAGALTVADRILVGDLGVGEMTVAGTAAVVVQGTETGDGLYVADGGGGAVTEDAGSTLTISAGSIDAYRLVIGNNGGASGGMTVAGGLVDVVDNVEVAYAAGSTGTLTVTGGTLRGERVRLGGGAGAVATMTISGGTVDCDSDGGSTRGLIVGYNDGATGTVTQTGGTVTTDAGADVQIGGEAGAPAGTADGTYTITNGTLTVGRTLVIGPDDDADTGLGTLHVLGTQAAISVGDDLTIPSTNAVLQVTLRAGGVSTIEVADDIMLNGTLTVGADPSFVQSELEYVVATSLNHSAVIGTFVRTNFLNGLTGISVTYDNGALALSFAPPDDPAAGAATADGPECVNLEWTPNAAGDDVLIVRRAGAAPSATPETGHSYAVGDSLGEGAVIYNGAGAAFLDTELQANTTHYYVFYSAAGSGAYSAGVSDTAVTEPFYATEFVDAFAYIINDELDGKNRGQGWTGAWAESDPGRFTIYEHTFSNFSGYMPNYGHKTHVLPGDDEHLSATRGISERTSGAVYAAFIMNYQYSGTDKFCGLSFMDGTTELAFAGKAYSSTDKLSLDVGGTVTESAYVLTPGYQEDYLLIMKYDFDTRVLAARAFYIDTETLPTREPEWQVTTTLDLGAISSIDGIRLGAGGDGAGVTPGHTYFDEIRVAASWNMLVNNLIAFQGFEDSGDSWGYTATPGAGTIAVSADRRASGETSLKLTGTSSLNTDPYVTFTALNLRGYNNAQLSIGYAASGPDSGDDLEFWIATNGGAFVKLGYVDGYNNSDFDFGEAPHDDGAGSITANPYLYAVPDDATNLALKVVYNESAGNNNTSDHWYIDDVKLTGVEGPEAVLLGIDGGEIANGERTPDSDRGTWYAMTVASEDVVDATFTITNRGLTELQLTGTPYVLLSGDTDHFSVLTQPTATGIAVAEAKTFTIRFAPTATGMHTGLVSIANSDTNDSPYTFAVQGEGILKEPPHADATGLAFWSVTNVSMAVSWANGDGAGRVVVARAGSAVTGEPVDGTVYTANAAFGSGDTVAAGEYVVYSGSGTNVTITGLTPETTYHLAVFEYSGTGGGRNYYAEGTPLTGSRATISVAPVISEGGGVTVVMSENGNPTPFALALHATDGDPGDTLTWSVLYAAEHGSAACSGIGGSPDVLGYAPAPFYAGNDAFTVRVTDSYGNTDTIAVSVRVTAVNAAGKTVFIFE